MRFPLGKIKPSFWIRSAAALGTLAILAFSFQGSQSPAFLAPFEYWWLMIVAAALAVAGFSVQTSWQTAGIVAATYMAGFGAQLALKDPLWFQHVRFLPTGSSYVIIAVIALQGVVAAWVLLRNDIFKHAFRVLSDLGWLRVFLLILTLLLASKSSMGFFAARNLAPYFVHLAVAAAFLAVNVSSLVAFLVTLPEDKLAKLGGWATQVISLPGSGDQTRRFDRVFPFCVAGTIFVICLLISVVAFEAVPHLDDIVYLFHARYFANGMLSLPLPPSIESFNFFLMDVYEGKWFSGNFPGWPLALAAGVIIGMPWVLNPIFAALSVLFLHHLVRYLSDRGTANVAALLMAISPWYLSISSTELLHTFTYTLILAAWVLLLEARRRPSTVLPLVAGFLMGWLFLTRPLEGLYMGTLTGLWTLTFLRDRRQWKTVILYGLGCLVVASLMLPYHAYLTGDALTTPLNAYLDKIWSPGANAIGFGPNIGPPDWGPVDVFKGHSPIEALINFHENFYELNSELFGWGGFSLIFAISFALWGKWNNFTKAMAVIVILTIGIYSLYWCACGFYTGPRYWFMSLVPLLIFTAIGIKTCVERFGRLYPTKLVPQRIGVGVCFLGICSILVFESWLGFNKFPEINRHHDDYQKLASQERFRNSLVFIASDFQNEFGSAFWLNDFSATSQSPLFARDLGLEANRLIASAYPERKIFFVDGRSRGRPQVKISRGPLAFGEAFSD